MKPHAGIKIGAALWGAFGLSCSYLWISGAIHEHWPLFRWLALIWFLSAFVGPMFLLAHAVFFEKAGKQPAALRLPLPIGPSVKRIWQKPHAKKVYPRI